jgi:hypothetical protein
MTTWVLVAMLYAGDGSRHYSEGDQLYPTSDLCIPVAEAVSRKLMEAHAGWAMCLGKQEADKLIAGQQAK